MEGETFQTHYTFASSQELREIYFHLIECLSVCMCVCVRMVTSVAQYTSPPH